MPPVDISGEAPPKAEKEAEPPGAEAGFEEVPADVALSRRVEQRQDQIVEAAREAIQRRTERLAMD